LSAAVPRDEEHWGFAFFAYSRFDIGGDLHSRARQLAVALPGVHIADP